MSKVQAKRHDDSAHGGKPLSSGKNNAMFYLVAVAAVVSVLIFFPKLMALTGLSFLAAGAGLNKLLSFVFAACAGWVCLIPSQAYRGFVALAKGARIEWRKTVKPDKDTVWRTTMMVLALVVLFALLVLVLDWIFGSILRSFVN